MKNDSAPSTPLSAAVPDRFERVRHAVSGRMPELDGLRGLAILIVIWHNAGLTWYHHRPGLLPDLFSLSANMGWLGVQLFFVLSGFLITGVLLDGKGRPRQLPNFYMRRVLRIFPLYFLVLIFAFIVLPALHAMPEWLAADRDRQLWYWTFLINWAAPVVGGGTTLSHFWSLAVEEQFYLLWPLLVVVCGRRALAWLCAAVVVSALVFRGWQTAVDFEFAQQAAYQFTVARWDALACGALLALALRWRGAFGQLERHSHKVFYAVAAYVVLTIVLRHNYAPVEPGFAVLNQSAAALFFALLIYFALAPLHVESALVARWLRFSLLRKTGKYSYAMYVFHLPMIHVWGDLRSQWFPNWGNDFPLLSVLGDIVVVLALSTLLALLSWRLIETPFLNLKRLFGQPPAGGALAAAPVVENPALGRDR